MSRPPVIHEHRLSGLFFAIALALHVSGRSGQFLGVARITNMQDGKETADPHGIGVRK